MASLRTLPLDQIDPPTRVLRSEIDQDQIAALAASIQAVGLLQPVGVVVDGPRYRLVFGHRRFLAHAYLGRPTIDALVATADEVATIEAAAAENVVRRDLSPVEEAQAIRHMMDSQGSSVRQIAAALGRSESWVRGRRELLMWPPEILDLVARGDLVPAVAHELVLVEDDTMRAIYTRAAVENGVTAHQARLWRQEWEAQRAYQGGTPEMGGGLPPQPSTEAPKIGCGVCDTLYPITAFVFVRTCPACVQALTDERRARH